MGITEINYLLSKMAEDGKSALDSLKLIEKSGLFSEEVIDEWYRNLNKFREKK